MKQYTHAWLAMLAIKRLEKVEIPEMMNIKGEPTPMARDAKLLVRLFKSYRDFVVKGACILTMCCRTTPEIIPTV